MDDEKAAGSGLREVTAADSELKEVTTDNSELEEVTAADSELDEGEAADGAPEEEPEVDNGLKEIKLEKKPRSETLRRVARNLLTFLLMALAVLVFAFRDRLDGASLRQTFRKSPVLSTERAAFTYETGARQVFARAGEGVAVASSSSVQLLDREGKTVFKQVVNYDTPAVFAGGSGALFCDLGGSGCLLVPFGEEAIRPEVSGQILSAGITEDGWFFLVTTEPGFKGLVTVYNPLGEAQYQWWSGSSYPLKAALRPDHKVLAVLCAGTEGGSVHFFDLNSEREKAVASYPDELLVDLAWLSNDSLAALSETNLHFLTAAGETRNDYALDGAYLLEYALEGGDLVVLFTGAYRSGAGGELHTFDSSGKPLGSTHLDRDVVSLSVSGRQVLVMTGGDLSLYNADCVRQHANETLMTARQAILRPGGDVLLLSAYAAERFKF